MTDTIVHPRVVVRRMSRSEYTDCLQDLILALVERYGPMTVATVYERVNQAIIDYGIDKAAAAVREAS